LFLVFLQPCHVAALRSEFLFLTDRQRETDRQTHLTLLWEDIKSDI